MIYWGILSLGVGILILIYAIKSKEDWDSPIAHSFRRWLAAITFIIIGINILNENL